MTTTMAQDVETLKKLPLGEWERNFIASVGEGIQRYGKLTDKQQVVFDRIVDKYLTDEGLPKGTMGTPSSGEKKKGEPPPSWYLKKLIEKLTGELKEDAEKLLAKLTPMEKSTQKIVVTMERKFSSDAPSLEDIPF